MTDRINDILQQAINENFEQNLLIDEDEDASLSTNYIETVPTSTVVFQLSCMAHTLHLGIKEGLKKFQVLDVAIGKFRDLLKKILGSPKLLEALRDVCYTLRSLTKSPNWTFKLDGIVHGR